MNNLDYLLKEFASKKIKLIIPEGVKKEVIDNPYNSKKYKLGSIRMNNLLKKKIINLPNEIGISKKEIENKTKEILKKTNKSFYTKKDWMKIIHKGEADCLSLSLIASEKKIKNMVVVDERTTRMLVENPENLRKLYEKKLKSKVKFEKSKLMKKLNGIKIIRSSEIVYIAYKEGMIDLKNGDVLDALLNAVKFKGCSISGEEISRIKKIKH